MNPSPSPIPVTVVAPPQEWWQIIAALSPFAVLIGAVVAGVIGFRQIKQKREADNRAEWWRRTQWALDAVYSGNPKRGTVGLKVLTVLAESKLAGPGELDVLEAAWESPLSEAEEQQTEGPNTPTARDAIGGGGRLGFDLRNGYFGLANDSDAVSLPQGRFIMDVRGGRIIGVDDVTEPRDNEEDDEPQPTGGGPR